jgi:hypothetical protein
MERSRPVADGVEERWLRGGDFQETIMRMSSGTIRSAGIEVHLGSGNVTLGL